MKATPTVTITSGRSAMAHKSSRPTLMGPASRKQALETEAWNKFVGEPKSGKLHILTGYVYDCCHLTDKTKPSEILLEII